MPQIALIIQRADDDRKKTWRVAMQSTGSYVFLSLYLLLMSVFTSFPTDILRIHCSIIFFCGIITGFIEKNDCERMKARVKRDQNVGYFPTPSEHSG